MLNPWLIRAGVAMVWLYEGLWCKVLGRAPLQEAVMRAIPFVDAAQARAALLSLGALECVLAIWVLCGRWPYGAALVQTVVLTMMNIGGVLWAGGVIPDPAGMLFRNFAFLLLAWIAAGEVRPHAAHA